MNENEYGGVSRDGRVSATVNRRDLKSSTTYTQGRYYILKGTEVVISSDSLYKEDHVRFTIHNGTLHVDSQVTMVPFMWMILQFSSLNSV